MKKKRSVLLDWAISYLIVLIIPLITVILNFYLNIETIKKGIYNANEIIVENIGNEMDRIMTEQENIYSYIYSDSYFFSWVSHRNKSPEFYSDAAKVSSQLIRFCRYSSDVNCLIYMPDENYIISNNSCNDEKYMYQSLRSRFDDFPEYNEWIEQLSGKYNNEFFFEKYMNYTTNQKCLIYANSLIFNGNKPVNIFISVPFDRVVSLTESLGQKGYFVMVNDDDIEIIGNEKPNMSHELKSLILSSENVFETKEYMGLIKKSQHKRVSYAMLIRQDDFWVQSTHIRNVFLVSIGLTLLVAIGIMSLLLRKNFMPVTNLIKQIGIEKVRGNEFYQIELAYSKLNNENKSMQQIFKTQKEALKGSYLLSIMKGSSESLKKNEIDFFEIEERRAVTLCGFYVLSEDYLLSFAIDNVFAELMEGEQFCRIEDGSYILYLFFIEPEKEKEFEVKYDEKMHYMCDFFEEKWNVNLKFQKTGYEEMNGIGTLYQKIMEMFALESGRKNGTQNVSREVYKIVTNILEYVEENFSDSSLNISSIAEFLEKNPKYISRVFREATGEGILDYVNKVRISKAKELIATRKYSLEEVGDIVGYTSNQTFRRAFSKIVGMTPGKYRDTLEK
ncbi:MAG: AraC family transcriptional regulator [Clostridiales bacterium]|nr:AraC family transcriptional regulator [Clostridiales bacterium]